jgi:hypothetical protein
MKKENHKYFFNNNGLYRMNHNKYEKIIKSKFIVKRRNLFLL